MENTEEVLAQLSLFDKSPVPQIPQQLEDYLTHIAKTGYSQFAWTKIKTLFKVKLENVIADFSGVSPVENVPAMPNVEEFKFEEMKTRIFEQLESYNGVPFTIQRLCELITQPYKNYKRIDKFLRGLERVMLVVSTIEPQPVQVESRSGLMNGFGGETSGLGLEPSGTSGLSKNEDKPVNSISNGLGRSHKSSDEEPGSRRLGDSLESPAKRMRLSIEEDGGPCDSADQIPPLVQEGSPPGNECMASPVSGLGAASPSTSMDSSPAKSEDSMEIDTECTSSQARMVLAAVSSEKESREAEPDITKDTDDGSTVATLAGDSDAVQAGPAEQAGTADGTSKLADETDGAAETSMETECEVEEGISTSAQSGPSNPVAQVENNSEAEASTGLKEGSGDSRVPAGELESVDSSENNKHSREEDIVADSSDEADQVRPPPAEIDGEPDQSESATASAVSTVERANTKSVDVVAAAESSSSEDLRLDAESSSTADHNSAAESSSSADLNSAAESSADLESAAESTSIANSKIAAESSDSTPDQSL